MKVIIQRIHEGSVQHIFISKKVASCHWRVQRPAFLSKLVATLGGGAAASGYQEA